MKQWKIICVLLVSLGGFAYIGYFVYQDAESIGWIASFRNSFYVIGVYLLVILIIFGNAKRYTSRRRASKNDEKIVSNKIIFYRVLLVSLGGFAYIGYFVYQDAESIGWIASFRNSFYVIGVYLLVILIIFGNAKRYASRRRASKNDEQNKKQKPDGE